MQRVLLTARLFAFTALLCFAWMLISIKSPQWQHYFQVVHATSCPTGYSNTYPIQIRAQTYAGTDQSNFPVYFAGNALLANTGSGGSSQLTSGLDIVFCDAASSGNLLAYELVSGSYVSTTGVGEWYINVPTVSHTVSKVIYAFVGNSGGTDHSNAAGTWTVANFLTVLHMGTASTFSATDSTGNQTYSNTSVTAASGQIGGAGSFNGTSSILTDSSASALSVSTGTEEIWINTVANGSGNANYFLGMSGASGGYYIRNFNAEADWVVTSVSGSYNIFRSTANDLTTGTFNYYAHTWNSTLSSQLAYFNGAIASTSNPTNGTQSNTIPTSNTTFTIGNVTSSGFANAKIDEVRISSVVRSADWLNVTYHSLSNPTAFYKFNPPACPTGYSTAFPLQVNAQTSVSTDQANFPMYFAGNAALAATTSGGVSQVSTGLDIVFCDAASGGFLLPYELVAGSYVSTTGVGEWYVSVPVVSHSIAEVIWVFAGKSGATDQSNLSGTWLANGYIGVYHFGPTNLLNDSSGNGFNVTQGTGTLATSSSTSGSPLGNSGHFGGASELDHAISSAFIASSGTAEMWLKETTFGSGNSNYWLFHTNNFCSGFGFRNFNSALDYLWMTGNCSTQNIWRTSSSYSTATWYSLASTWTGSGPTLGAYLNGAAVAGSFATSSSGTANTLNGVLSLGGIQEGAGDYMNGDLDEVRISNVVRSGDYLAVTYQSENSPSTFYAFNPPPTFSPTAPALFTGTEVVTITNAGGNGSCVTTDGTTPTATTPGTCSHGSAVASGGTVSFGVTTTVKALGTASGQLNTTVATGVYTYSPVFICNTAFNQISSGANFVNVTFNANGCDFAVLEVTLGNGTFHQVPACGDSGFTGGSNTWNVLSSTNIYSSGVSSGASITLVYATNLKQGTGTISCNWPQTGGGYDWVFVAGFQGLNFINVDQQNAGSGSTANPSISVTNSNGPDLVVAGFSLDSSTILRFSNMNTSYQYYSSGVLQGTFAWGLTNAPGSFTATTTNGSSGSYIGNIATFHYGSSTGRHGGKVF